ncbi:MAG: 5-methylthioadenosine/S-adenosylhomocysteine deaminase [Methanosarcinales archeaon 56_1174]|nr:MAG: 5-methylthioadenosine/S-adenosylhomocysteine deaminase [Methanosarcinales archeaon 56_1174]
MAVYLSGVCGVKSVHQTDELGKIQRIPTFFYSGANAHFMNAELLIKGGLVLVGDGSPPKRADVVIDEGKLVRVGEARGISADEVIDGSGRLVMPAFVNTHTHLAMTLFRGYADDLSLDVWLGEHIWPIEAKLRASHVRAGALMGALELIRSGVGTFCDMYFFMDEVARVIEESGLRGFIGHGMIELGDERRGKKELSEARRLVREYEGHADGRVRMHLLETQKEKEELEERHGRSIVSVLSEMGFLGGDVLAAHCVWLSDEDIRLLHHHNVKVSHNPVSNMKLASGVAKVPEMLDAGINISLGTDGCASNNNLDMLGEMKAAALLHKVFRLSPTVMSAPTVLQMATLSGYRALGLNGGLLREGYDADLVMLDLTSERLLPLHNVVSNIVYSASPCDVVSTIVQGKVLMHERVVRTLDAREVAFQFARAVDELFESKA